MVQLKIGASLFNKRARATTASQTPSLPGNDSNSKYSPKGPEEYIPNINLPMTFQAQKHINMCGDACVNMLYEYHGKKAPNNLKINSRGVFEGMNTDGIVKNFGTAGGGSLTRWRPNWAAQDGDLSNINPARLAYGLHQHGPLMWSGEFARFIGKRWGHWIVVHGVMEDTVLIADPWHGNERKKPFSWFVKHMSKDADDRPFYVI